jgi:hypothetical protein
MLEPAAAAFIINHEPEHTAIQSKIRSVRPSVALEADVSMNPCRVNIHGPASASSRDPVHLRAVIKWQARAKCQLVDARPLIPAAFMASVRQIGR